MVLTKLLFASTASISMVCATNGNAQPIELTTTRSLAFAGYTTSPLRQAEQMSSEPVTKAAMDVLPMDIRAKLGIASDVQMSFLDLSDQGYFWFKGDADYDEISLEVANEDGWYSSTRASVAINDTTVFSLDNVPFSSKEFTVFVFKGKRFEAEKPFMQFKVQNPYRHRTSSDSAKPATYLIKKNQGNYRLTIKEVASGIASLQSRHKQEGRNTKEDVFNPDLIPAKMPRAPYSSILWELDKKTEATGIRGALENVLGDGYDPVRSDWKAYATVTDSRGQVWSTDFSGSRSGWGDTSYMETRVNLPASEGPLNFDLYLVDQKNSTKEFTNIVTFAVPGQRQALDVITSTAQNVRMKIGIVGSMHKVPPQISQGVFEGNLVYVDSVDPVPDIEMRIETADGKTINNDGYNLDTHGDKIHRSIFTFGSADPKAEDYIKPGTSATLSIRIPEHLHFQFNAIPVRPGKS